MTHRKFRGIGWTAAIAGLVVATALAASGVAAKATPAATHAARVHLAYSCRFPSAARQVGVTVAATFPTAAAAGKPIQPTGPLLTVSLPRPALTGLATGGATQLAVTDVLSMTVGYGAGAGTTVQWPGQLPKPIAIPTTGSLPLPIPSQAPPIIASRPGSVTFAAAGLSLSLTLSKPGAIAAPAPAVQVPCTLNPGQQATLDTVQVVSSPSSPSPSAPASQKPGARPSTGPVTHPGSTGGVPPGCVKRLIQGGTSTPTLGCANLIGYADVRKLNGAALVGSGPGGNPPAAFLNADSYATGLGCVPVEPTLTDCTNHHGHLHLYICTFAQLKGLAFPPVHATFLTFGFAPVSAVVQLSETTWPSSHPPVEDPRCYLGFNPSKPVKLTGPAITVLSDTDNSVASQPVVSTGTTYLSVHVSQVTVNGVSLPVGPNCTTSQPMLAALTGVGTNNPVTGYTLPTGGPLTGKVTIPTFINCGVTENLDPLLNGTISGPANFQLITQGTLCTPQNTALCPPSIPKPLRHA